MKDSGDWYFRKMMDVDLDELKSFLKEISVKGSGYTKIYTEQEKIDMEIWHKTRCGFESEYHRKVLKKFRLKVACGLLGIEI